MSERVVIQIQNGRRREWLQDIDDDGNLVDEHCTAWDVDDDYMNVLQKQRRQALQAPVEEITIAEATAQSDAQAAAQRAAHPVKPRRSWRRLYTS